MKKSVFLFIAVCVSYCSFAAANVTVGPYLQSPTTTGIKIMWRTDGASIGKVMYGTDKANLSLTQMDTVVGDSTRHMVTLKGLSPYTVYYYAIYNDNVFAEGGDDEHKFRTFPVSTDPGHVRVWGIGDFGKGNSKEAQVRDSYPFDSVETNLWVWMGDNAYDNGSEAQYLTKVFDSVYGYKKIMKHLPFLPCPGNHDYEGVQQVFNTKPPLTHTGPYYDFIEVYKNGEAGGVPTGHELFYSYDYRNVHFISLNSELGSFTNQAHNWTGIHAGANTFTSSPMSDWLNQDLAANTKPWVVVYFHQCPYTQGSHNSADAIEYYMEAMRNNFNPIFEQYGVDVVLCGHTHVYERSYLVHGSYGKDADIDASHFVQKTSGKESLNEAYRKSLTGSPANYGTVYVNNGNSGSDESGAPMQHPYMYAGSACSGCVGSFVMDIEGNKLKGRHIASNGTVLDDFTIIKDGISTDVEKINNEGSIDGLKVFPNPFGATTTVSFNLAQTEKIQISMTDVTGRVVEVFEGAMQKGNQQITVDAQKLKLAKGVYTLQVSSGTQNISRKLVIQ